MQKLLGAVALSLIAPALVGQCIIGTGISYGIGDDVVMNGGAGIDMGFAIPFAGSTYQFIHPCSNGFAYLSDGSPTLTNGDYTPTVAEFYAEDPRVAPFWVDLNLEATYSADLMVDTGVPGECTVTWINAVLWGQTVPFTIQMVLRATGDIDFVYDGSVYQQGDTIVGTSPGFGIATPATSADLTAAMPILDDMAYELFPGNAFDIVGQAVSMIPLVPGYLPVVGGGGCASKDTYGAGCISTPNAKSELFDIGAIDICGSGTAITFLRGSMDYTILDGIPGTFVPPVAGVIVSTGDDAFGVVPLSMSMPTVAGVTSTLQVCTNGYIGLSANQPSLTADYSPSEGEFAAFTEPTICGPWYDWSPNVGGQIVYEEVAGIMYVTWDAVTPYNVATTDTFQYQFELATGNCTIVYDNMSFGGASGWHTPLFGYTAGNAVNSETVDMSAVLPGSVIVPDVGRSAVDLDSNLPVLGANWDLTTSNIDAVSPIAITFLGSGRQDPGLPLSLIGLNAPGCSIYLNAIIGDLTGLAVAGVATSSLSIPGNPVLQGMLLTAQSVCLTLDNGANLLTSNGVEGTVGL